MEIPESYRVTQHDVKVARKAQAAYFVDHEPWSEEMEFAWLCLDADDMYRRTGEWPTLGEVLAQREEEENVRVHKRAERNQR